MMIKIIILVTFGILTLISVHEAGHFIAARLLNVKVRRVSIGFGKVLLRWHDGLNTEYVLCLLPLGGYVQLLDDREQKIAPKDKAYAFNHQPRYKQFIILAAGSFCNFLLAFLLYWIVYSVGITFPTPIIGSVTPHSIASTAGLTPLQKMKTIDNRKVDDWQEVVFCLLMKYGSAKKMDITVQDLKTNQVFKKTLSLSQWRWDALRPDPIRSLGIMPLSPKDKAWSKRFFYTKQYPFYQGWLPAFNQTLSVIELNGVVLVKILTGILSVKVVSGPLGALKAAAFASSQGVLIYLLFLAFMNASLGFINLLPWPGLDGGRILFLGIELITRHTISYAWEVLLSRLGLIILIVFIAETVINDLLRMMMQP
jgi:regulator of sigma E protease